MGLWSHSHSISGSTARNMKPRGCTAEGLCPRDWASHFPIMGSKNYQKNQSLYQVPERNVALPRHRPQCYQLFSGKEHIDTLKQEYVNCSFVFSWKWCHGLLLSSFLILLCCFVFFFSMLLDSSTWMEFIFKLSTVFSPWYSSLNCTWLSLESMPLPSLCVWVCTFYLKASLALALVFFFSNICFLCFYLLWWFGKYMFWFLLWLLFLVLSLSFF